MNQIDLPLLTSFTTSSYSFHYSSILVLSSRIYIVNKSYKDLPKLSHFQTEYQSLADIKNLTMNSISFHSLNI